MEGIPASIIQLSRITHGWKTGSACASVLESPTKTHSSPTWMASAERVAVRTHSPAREAGSYCTSAKLCVGCRKRTTAGTSTVDANSTLASPGTTGTVLRSRRTNPREASTTRPQPTYLRHATPSIWYGMSKSTRTSDGVTACTSSGPASAKDTCCGTGGGGGGGGGQGRPRHCPLRSSRV